MLRLKSIKLLLYKVMRIMKVKCIARDSGDMTIGKIYEVISIENGWYRIVDNSGEDYLYSPEAFEVVEE